MGFVDGLLNLLFPPRCVFCRKLLRGGDLDMCSDCKETLPWTEGGAGRSGEAFSECVSPLYYEGAVRDSILRFKFKDATAYAKFYGKLIAACVDENLKGAYDLISWVPLSAERLKARGYDQAMLIAMAAALELSDVAVETLVKHTDVPAQSGVGGESQRKANIEGAYRVKDTELIAGKRILLIDDIVTTGSTLSECAATLIESGAVNVVCAALAQTREETYFSLEKEK